MSLLETLRFVERTAGPGGVTLTVLPWTAGQGLIHITRPELTAFLATLDALIAERDALEAIL